METIYFFLVVKIIIFKIGVSSRLWAGTFFSAYRYIVLLFIGLHS